ncbi:hypothetical protein DYB37_000413 [Aphanomyces astaci]|uniref:Ras-related GTP-binding protein n=1 Tax=Aphanomyces astaci TaxID=112090 RepID=A0A3R7E9J7_APHAT|nr:hypothetical protein DYB35_000213 [Aphanomyces astaci]RHZ25570.1 hypothetical protein DYB37_000413 [Aphanomyces astaci]
MGKSGSGKTSMRSIIFANYLGKLNGCVSVAYHRIQDAFYENYFESQRDHIFRSVELLIYVFDIESRELEKDMNHFDGCLEAIEQNSESAKVFVLIHKMDLVPESQRDAVFDQRKEMILSRTGSIPTVCFGTSIWDETLYRAWSSIVYSLIPNMQDLENHLNEFCAICNADEVVLFERATFLVIAHATHKSHRDIHRFEKISNIIKQFKLSCSKTQAQFQGMEVRNSNFTAFMDFFTNNTYIMVIMSDDTIQPATTQLNIKAARPVFERYVQQAN